MYVLCMLIQAYPQVIQVRKSTLKMETGCCSEKLVKICHRKSQPRQPQLTSCIATFANFQTEQVNT